MQLFQLYAAILGGIISLLLLSSLWRLFAHYFLPSIESAFLRHLRYPLVISPLRWIGRTRLEFLVILAYISVNSVLLGVYHENIQQKAAGMAAINLIPTFFEGLLSRLAGALHIPLATSHLMHRWAGRVAIVEALLHSVLAIMSHKGRGSAKTTSGYIAAACLVAILVLTVGVFWRFLQRYSSRIHAILTMGLIAGLAWHVIFEPSLVAKLPTLIASGLWAVALMYRIFRALFFNVGATVVEVHMDGQVTRFKLKTNRAVRVPHGSYFYVFFPGSLRYYPLMVTWHTPLSVVAYQKITDLVFIASHQQSFGGTVLGVGQTLHIDGPYHRDLGLAGYDTVILAAKGLGIVSILPLALGIIDRRTHDESMKSVPQRNVLRAPLYRDTTRRVDIFWQLEDNIQEDWIASELRVLQSLDPLNKLFAVWCIYPAPRTKNPPFTENRHWIALYHDSSMLDIDRIVDGYISAEVQTPGKSVVVCSGDRPFSDNIRQTIINQTTRDRVIAFAETDFQPPSRVSKMAQHERPVVPRPTQDDMELALLRSSTAEHSG